MAASQPRHTPIHAVNKTLWCICLAAIACHCTSFARFLDTVGLGGGALLCPVCHAGLMLYDITAKTIRGTAGANHHGAATLHFNC